MKIKLGKKHILNLKTFIVFIITLISLLFLGWCMISYIDTMIYQFDGGTQHTWNLFKMMTGR